MDLTDNNPKEPDSGMGNEVSQADGVKQSVGGGGKVGQFHRVLVESEYSVPDFKEPIEDSSRDPAPDGVDQATLKIRGERGSELNADDHRDSDRAEQTNLDIYHDSDYSLIEECKALISEAADRAVQRSVSRTSATEQVTDLDEVHVGETVEEVQVIEQAKSVSVLKVEQIKPGTSHENTYSEISVDEDVKPDEVKSQKIESEIAKPVKGNHIDLNYALKCGIITASDEVIFDSNKIHDKGKKRKAKSADNIFQREVIESVKQHFDSEDNLDTERPTPEAKNSKGNFIAKMFKFSKRKPRTDADESVDIKNQMNVVEENASESNTQSVKSADVEISNGGQASDKIRQVRRLNSLDSGIVVDKVNEQANNSAVEYAVVQKTRPTDLEKTDDSGSLKVTTAEIIQPVRKGIEPEQGSGVKEATTSEQNEVVYINGNKTNEDYVYVNERGVDVEGLGEPDKTVVSETLMQVGSEIVNKVKEKSVYEDERQSNISTDSGTSSGSKIRRSDVTQPEKAKLKKKSWSFQLVGKKKQSGESESESVVSMDPNASQSESKKPKWRFGKFSFRKDNDGVSSSTPNLHKAGIPEGEEVVLRKKTDDKKKMKLKKIKAKKDKKKSPEKNRSSLDMRSTSMIEIGRGEPLEPRSRRSIVEEDLQFTQTDVFEGVSLSDLSQDEEAEVSTNPAGATVSEKKNGSKKATATVSGKIADKVISVVGTKTDQHVVQSSFEAATSNSQTEKKGEAKLTKLIPTEDTSVKAATLSENASVQSCSTLEPGNPDDEYVNIVPSKAETVECVLAQNVNSNTEDNEYAQVVKRKTKLVQDSDNKEVPNFKSTIQEQLLKIVKDEVSNVEKPEDDQMETKNINKMTEDDDILLEESKTKQTVQTACETAFSNMIYSDEEFRSTLASMEKANGEHEDDESDAYVELQQIVEDFGSEKDKIHSIQEKEEVQTISASSDEKTVTEKLAERVTEKAESVLQEKENAKPVLEEIIDKHESIPAESLTTKSIVTTEKTDTGLTMSDTHVSRDGSVIVVKDVGVQVPDIYMPLDKDKDFGFTANNIPCVSIGIQVTDKDLDVEHVVVSLKTDDVTKPLKEHSPAYF